MATALAPKMMHKNAINRPPKKESFWIAGECFVIVIDIPQKVLNYHNFITSTRDMHSNPWAPLAQVPKLNQLSQVLEYFFRYL